MRLLPEHVSGARGLLRISTAELAARAGVSERTIQRFEVGSAPLKDATMLQIRAALENWGIEFQNSGRPGVRYHPDRDRRRLTRAESAKPVE